MKRTIFAALIVLFAAACSDTAPEPTAPSLRPTLSVKAENVECVGLLVGGVFDNVTVPKGQSCLIADSEIKGNLKALEDSRLFSTRNRIAGNVQADKPGSVHIEQDEVGGNIEIIEGRGASGPATTYVVFRVAVATGNVHVAKSVGSFFLSQITIAKGNLKIEENVVPNSMSVFGNSVAQNIQAMKNKGPGEKSVFSNLAGESVQCFENDPPFFGGANVAPKLEGQCGVPPTAF